MSADGDHLGDSRLGHSKLGPVTQAPGDLTAETTPRDRFDDWVKSAFPTEPGTTWDDFLDTLAGEFEDVLATRRQIYNQQFIDTATRAQLDRIGAFMGVERRRGEPDALYRRRIKVTFREYTAGGTINEVLSMSSTVLECETDKIELIESFDQEPARFDIFLNEQIVDRAAITVDEYIDLMRSIKAAGVRVNATIGAQFTYRSEYEFHNGINDPDRGYASLDGSIEGAPYADIITAEHRSGTDEDVDTTPFLTGFGEGGFGHDEFGS